MNSSVVREKFFNFFKEKGHQIIPSSSVVNKTDKNLMFTNAGMNQFRNIFTGDEDPEFTKVANSQKCLRVSGKHNDLEEVGVDTYHHTFFEMLGNWSFDDYFKKEIIQWSYELITDIYKIKKEDIYVSVFEGSEEDNTNVDIETFNEWKRYFSEDKIIYGNKKDNFWEMGDHGPCGPCSEIHIDLRSSDEKKIIKGSELVNKDHPQVVEIWNLVFIQFNRMKDGSLEKLDKRYVDTGMGLERLCMALQNKQSTYETDLFADIIKKIEIVSNKKYLNGDQKIDVAIRVVSDHLRAIIFTISDGQTPNNTGPGYVVRRILRRAIRYGYTNLDIKEPFIYKLVELVVKQYSDIYPDLINQKDFIASVINDEEKAFLKTLNQGLTLINKIIISNKKDNIIDGEEAFKLYDTYGFPVDLTSLIANENNFKVDLEGFENNMKIQKKRSKKTNSSKISDWVIINKKTTSEFLGYDFDEIECLILKYRKLILDNGDIRFHIVFDRTTFFPEGGGQIGDIGIINYENNSIMVYDTFKEGKDIIHVTNEIPEKTDTTIKLKINRDRRSRIESNHTSTHLLNQALRDILGNHVQQKGSMISDEIFRFDFSHSKKISDSQIESIENFVKDKINQSISLIENRDEDYDKAISNGALGFFTEKYGKRVRTIKFDESYELCGGTHVKNTNEIFNFKIISEGSQAFGIRRIVATSIKEAIHIEEKKAKELNEKKLQVELKKKDQKETDQNNKIRIQSLKNEIINNMRQVKDLNVYINLVDVDPKSIKELSFQLADNYKNLFLILISNDNKKVFISCFISKNLVDEKNINASEIIKDLTKYVNGSGGGQKFYATGGGNDLSAVNTVIEKSETFVNQL